MTDRSGNIATTKTASRTQRWKLPSFIVIALFTVGLVTFDPGVLTLAVVGITFGIYANAALGGDGRTLELERTIQPVDPRPGQTVRVTVTLHNTGSKLLPDIRFVDGVPGALMVTEGTPRCATALRSGEKFTHEYGITAVRGEHSFTAATAAVRSLGGAFERELSIETETSLTCSPPLSNVPLRSQTSIFSGRLPTEVGGTGLEFHSVREYRSGDPLKRVNWRRYAKTGELATVNFREQRAATVVLLIDNRPAAYWAASSGDRHAVEHSVTAAGQVFGALVRNGDKVGITTFDSENDWLAPSAGQAALAEARHFLATHPGLQYSPPEDLPELVIDPEHPQVNMAPFLARLPDDAQIIAFTPLCDDGIVQSLKRFEASGHATTVVSPDVTQFDSIGHLLARTQRSNRVATLRDDGIRVLDWETSTTLEEVLVADTRRGDPL